jgi:glucose/arabinose dehydrogenase
MPKATMVSRSRRAPLALAAVLAVPAAAGAQPSMNDPSLVVTPVVPLFSLNRPTSIDFLAAGDMLVLEKETGQVRRILNDALQPTPALDAAVNFDGESGMLGIAIDPGSPTRVFLYYTEAAVDGGPALGNRIYRYDWDPGTGTLINPLMLLDLPADTFFHNGGVLVWDDANSHLYGVIGDQGHFGQLQNLAFSNPPDNTSVIVRLNADGSPPAGNPFTPYCNNLTTQTCTTSAECPAGGTCLTQVALYYSYGVRNCFGITIDPVTGMLWDTENGPDVYDEVNQVPIGANSGWLRIMGPVIRDPEGTADLFNMPGERLTYNDPEFSWLTPIAPTGIAFPFGSSWGPLYDQVAIVSDAAAGGQISSFPLNGPRDAFVLTGGLADLVADNQAEQDQVVIGSGFDTLVGLERGLETPNPHLYAVAIWTGTVYRIAGPVPVTLQGFSVE